MATNNAINASSTGFLSLNASGTINGRTLTAGAGISITNGDGISGNPIITATGGAVETFTFISTATASASANLTFTSIANTYKAYRFLLSNLVFSGTTTLNVALSIDNFSTSETINGTLVQTYCKTTVPTQFASSGTVFPLCSTTGHVSGFIDLFTPAVSANQAMLQWLIGTADNATTTSYGANGFANDSVVNAVNAIRFVGNAGTITSGTISMYGIS
jgi:hypothetical protein